MVAAFFDQSIEYATIYVVLSNQDVGKLTVLNEHMRESSSVPHLFLYILASLLVSAAYN